jgi:SAM-dependent methyltransferase
MGVDADGAAYYRANYPDYERQNPPAKIDFYLRLVGAHAAPGSRLHEVGVGLGVFIAAASREYACSGSEVNAFGLAEAARRAPRARLSPGSYEQIPVDDPPDVVVAWDVLEHIPDLDAALDVTRERLAPGGVLIAVVPVYDGPLGWLVTLLDRDPTHVSKWPRRRWVETLNLHGFDVIASGGVLRRLILGRWYLHVTRPAGLWRIAGSALWFVARPRRGAAGTPGTRA